MYLTTSKVFLFNQKHYRQGLWTYGRLRGRYFQDKRSQEELISTLSKRRLTNNKKEMGTQMAKWSKYMNKKRKT